VPVEVHTAFGVAPGAAYSDTESEFPQSYSCFALFLDWGNALVLEKRDGTVSEYQRIGIARFIWTPSQKEAACRQKLDKIALHRGIMCHGPITDQDKRVDVTIVWLGVWRKQSTSVQSRIKFVQLVA
jgi:hypothetical protein